MCYGSWGHKESDTTERLNLTEERKPVKREEKIGVMLLKPRSSAKHWKLGGVWPTSPFTALGAPLSMGFPR